MAAIADVIGTLNKFSFAKVCATFRTENKFRHKRIINHPPRRPFQLVVAGVLLNVVFGDLFYVYNRYPTLQL